MLGHEAATLEALEERPLQADRPRRRAGRARRAGVGRKGAIAPFDLDIHPGEVVGLAGLLGSGRTELARLLFGADHADSGHVVVDGKPVTMHDPRVAMAQGIAFCPENRKTEGLVARADDPREHHPGHAGGARLDAADPAQAPGRARRQVHQGARHPPGQARAARRAT